MAYLDLTQPLPGLLPAVDSASRAVPADGGLTDLDRTAIALSRSDPRSSLTARGRFRKIIAYLFSLQPPNALADPQLDALRRFAVRLRKGRGHILEAETARLVAAGYSSAAAEEARRIVSAFARS